MRLSPGAICKGLAEEELLRRVMQNLLKNCLQYSVGEVVVSTTQGTDLPVRLPHNRTPEDFICICVQNPIAGDSKLEPYKIFQRFYCRTKRTQPVYQPGIVYRKTPRGKMQGEVFAIRDENLLRIGFYLRTGL